MKSVICIFAHPDDEAFGPGGTIALLAEKNPVYIICVTDGDAGINSSDAKKDLSSIRKSELKKSAKILGVRDVYFLGYKDGCLCNGLYHEIADKITKIIKNLNPDTLLTFEPEGVSGHIDHITISMITSFLYEKMDYLKVLMHYCISKESRALEEPYFIYFPPGYSKNEISETYDISTVWDKKIASILAHKSQKHDAIRVMKKLEKLPKEEHFLVKKRAE